MMTDEYFLFRECCVLVREKHFPSTSVSLLLSCVPAGCVLMFHLKTWLKRHGVSLKK